MNVVEVNYEFQSVGGLLRHNFKILTSLTKNTVILALNDWKLKSNTGLPEEFIDHLTSFGFTVKKI